VLEGILLIGGGSSVGKTTAALSIAHGPDVEPVVHLDDVRRENPRAVHRLDVAGVWDSAPSDLLQLLLEETASVRAVLAHLVGGMGSDGLGAIIEGEGVEPELVDTLGADAPARFVYVIETDPVVLRRTLASRPSAGRFLALSPGQQQAVVEMNRLYATWLRDEAVRRSQAWVQSRPWATLPQRVLRAVGVR
jgi:hypothetical protein